MISMIGYKELVNLILSARERLIVCMPGLHKEVANAILDRVEEIDDLRVITDVSEQSVRSGYGDIESVAALLDAGVCVKWAPYNLVSFIIADEQAFFLFLQSRIISDNEDITNAVEMDSLTSTRLLAQFFPPSTEWEMAKLADEVSAATKKVQDSLESNLVVNEPVDMFVPDKPLTIAIKRMLEINPPLAPDLQRQIKTYNAEIAFVEFQFNGMNFNSAKVTLPPQALPFKDEMIKARLETRMRLFGDLKNDPHFEKVEEIKKKVFDLRRQFLIPIASRQKSVIRMNRRAAFDREVEGLKASLTEANKELDLWLETEILNSRERVKNELLAFLKEQPPEIFIKLKKHPELFEKKIDNVASDIVSKIQFPETGKIMTKMEFQVHYYDLTWDDFMNQKFLDELAEKKVFEKGKLEQIVEMKTAFGIKKDEKISAQTIPV